MARSTVEKRMSFLEPISLRSTQRTMPNAAALCRGSTFSLFYLRWMRRREGRGAKWSEERRKEKGGDVHET
jgi:hypothetical protein